MMVTKHVIGNKQDVLRFKIKFYLGSSSDFFCENALISSTCTYLICNIFKPGLTLKFKKKTGRDKKKKERIRNNWKGFFFENG